MTTQVKGLTIRSSDSQAITNTTDLNVKSITTSSASSFAGGLSVSDATGFPNSGNISIQNQLSATRILVNRAPYSDDTDPDPTLTRIIGTIPRLTKDTSGNSFTTSDFNDTNGFGGSDSKIVTKKYVDEKISTEAYTLPQATTSALGGVIAGSGTSIATDGTLSIAAATNSNIGGIKSGTGTSVIADGTLSVAAATTSTIGGVIVGSGTSVTSNGTLSVSEATTSTVGGVIAGSGTTIATDGTLSVAAATTSTIGGVIAGSGTSVASNGTLSISNATTSSVGGIKAGSGTAVATDGTLSVAPATTSTVGGVKQGSGVSISADGTISASASGASETSDNDFTGTNTFREFAVNAPVRSNALGAANSLLYGNIYTAPLVSGSTAATNSVTLGPNVSSITTNARFNLQMRRSYGNQNEYASNTPAAADLYEGFNILYKPYNGTYSTGKGAMVSFLPRERKTRLIFNTNEDSGGTVEAISITPNGVTTITNESGSSDDRLKTNEVMIENAMDTILKLKPQTYTKSSHLPGVVPEEGERPRSHVESGLIAQEVYYDAPELRHILHLNGNEILEGDPSTSDDPQSDPDYASLGWTGEPVGLRYRDLIAYLIKGMKELKSEIDNLRNDIK